MNTFSLSPPLVKAARALLEWQQRDLARAAGLSLTAIHNYERNIGETRERTLIAIQNALECQGIEFLPGGGLRRTDDLAAILRFGGPNFIAKWGEDCLAAVRREGEEILTSSTDESLWYLPAHLKTNDIYLAWAERLQLKLKSLVPEGQKMLHRSRRIYRALPPDMIGKITYCIYADRLAFVLWKKKQVVVLRNTSVVETFRNQFAHLWKLARPV